MWMVSSPRGPLFFSRGCLGSVLGPYPHLFGEIAFSLFSPIFLDFRKAHGGTLQSRCRLPKQRTRTYPYILPLLCRKSGNYIKHNPHRLWNDPALRNLVWPVFTKLSKNALPCSFWRVMHSFIVSSSYLKLCIHEFNQSENTWKKSRMF
jgi:hypothetical protein